MATALLQTPSDVPQATTNGQSVYSQTPETKHERMLPMADKHESVKDWRNIVDWADLVTLDLSLFDVPGGKQKLANQLRDAVHNVGRYYCGFRDERPAHFQKAFSILPTSACLKRK